MSERADLRKMLEADDAYAVEFALAQCESMDDAFAIKDARIAELEAEAAEDEKAFAAIVKSSEDLKRNLDQLSARIAELEQQASLWKAEYEAARDCYDEQDVEIAALKGLLREVMERWGMYRFAVEGYKSEKNLLSRINAALSDKGDAS